MQTTRPVTAEPVERRPLPAAPAPARRSILRTGVFVLFGLGLVAASILGTGWVHNNSSHVSGSPPAVGPTPEEVYAVALGHVDVESRLINLFSVHPGEVTEIPEKIKETAPVKKGEVLFRMDDRQAKFNVQLALDALDDAKLKLSQAEKTPEQHRSLVLQQESALEAKKREKAGAEAQFQKANRLLKNEPPLIAKEDRDSAQELVAKAEQGIKAEEEKLAGLKLQEPNLKFEIDRAKVDVSAKKTQWEQAKYALEKCELRAPCDGTVLRLLVSVGDVLGSNSKEPAIIFCPAQKRIIRAELEQEFASKIFVGQSALIRDDSHQKLVWHGKVKRISDWYLPKRSTVYEPRQFNDVRTMECIVELDDEKGLKIGQRVRVILGE